jgi:hypothetical protein
MYFLLCTARTSKPPMQQTNCICTFYGSSKDTLHATSPHSLAHASFGFVRREIAPVVASSIAPSSPAYRELNFICPQFEQVHHCRSISVVQYSQRQVGGRGGAGVEPDTDADTDDRCA